MLKDSYHLLIEALNICGGTVASKKPSKLATPPVETPEEGFSASVQPLGKRILEVLLDAFFTSPDLIVPLVISSIISILQATSTDASITGCKYLARCLFMQRPTVAQTFFELGELTLLYEIQDVWLSQVVNFIIVDF